MRRFLPAIVAVFALAGCASVPEYRQAGSGDYYYEREYAPDYVTYSAYYSALWPTYHYYYDPFWSPHFHYGVTWYPHNLFGFQHYASWPYWSYSPWYGSWWDSYYDWSWWEREQNQQRNWRRFGSARNEAAAVAALQRNAAPQRGDGGLPLARGANDSGERGLRANPTESGEIGATARTQRDTALPRRDRNDDLHQPRTGTVDPYYGAPRIQRGAVDPLSRREPRDSTDRYIRNADLAPQRGQRLGQPTVEGRDSTRIVAERTPLLGSSPAATGRTSRQPSTPNNAPARAPTPSAPSVRSSAPTSAPASSPARSHERSGGDRR